MPVDLNYTNASRRCGVNFAHFLFDRLPKFRFMKTKKAARKQVKKNSSARKKTKSISELVNHGRLEKIPLTESYFTGNEYEPKKSKGADEEL